MILAPSRFAALALALAVVGAGVAHAYPEPAQERPEPPRRTLPFPQEYDRPVAAAGPVLNECHAGRILIGTLEAPRARGGIFSRDLREAPSFDGIPVQAPGFFRLQRAEDAIGYTRGRHGILGTRDPYLLRGEVITRSYKEKRPYWAPPGATTERLFTAGSIQRTPFVRLEMGPRDFMRHLRGEEAKMALILENPTDYFIPDVVVRLFAEPEHTSFPLERRMELDFGWKWDVSLTTDLGPMQEKIFHLKVPGKANPELYKQIEADVLAARRWPYPPLAADHRVRPELSRAGADLARLMPERRLLVTAGDITGCGASPYPVVVRVDRRFRAFGAALDGFDLEVMAAWSDRRTKTFLRLLNQNAPRLPESLPPLLTAALHARDHRVPVKSRPGGYDDFDSMAHYLYGALANADHGHTGFSSADDDVYQDMDALARQEGIDLPPVRRRELRERLKKIFAGRRVRGLSPEAAAGGPHDYPVQDDRLPGTLEDGIYRPRHDHVGDKARLRKHRAIRRQKLDVRYRQPIDEEVEGGPRTYGETRIPSRSAGASSGSSSRPASRPSGAAASAPAPSRSRPVRSSGSGGSPPAPNPVPAPTPTMEPAGEDDFEDDFSGF